LFAERAVVLSDPSTIDATQSPGGVDLPRLAYLVVRHDDRPQVIDLQDGADILIGRSAEATVQLDDARVSREHARIRRQGPAISVIDLGGRNGTRVNADILRNQERRIASGDVIGVGQAELVVAETLQSEPPRDERPLPAGLERLPAMALLEESGVVVADPRLVRVFDMVRRVAPTPTTVLILGETGAGKEVVAEQIHRQSKRAGGPLVRLNCGSLPPTLLESELFGHEKGAFTGADRKKLGYLDAADGGTLFLDEIGELTLAMQARLLRVLETRRFMRVGARDETAVDVRIVAATNRDLEAEAGAGRFREDLYFRLAAFVIEIPPLRDRPAEITLLTELFLRRFAARMGMAPPLIAPDAVAAIARHRWPGNVRELRNAIERAIVLVDAGVLRAEHLPDAVRGLAAESAPSSGAGMRDQLDELEQRNIVAALAAEHGNQTRAAKRLGISRRALIYKMAKHELGKKSP
jgi:two-component system response regulator AtoC